MKEDEIMNSTKNPSEISPNNDEGVYGSTLSSEKKNTTCKWVSKNGDACGKNLCSLGNLKRHMLIVHNDVRPFKCSVCGKAFKEKGNLRKHEKSIHLGQEKNNVEAQDVKEENKMCKECDFVSTDGILLERHQRQKHPNI